MMTKRQRNSYAYFAVMAALLLFLLSVFLLYNRLSSDRRSSHNSDIQTTSPMIEDFKFSDQEVITMSGLNLQGEDTFSSSSSSTGYYFDHVSLVVRRALDRRSMDDVEQWNRYATPFVEWFASDNDRTKVVFGSDDVPVDAESRRKLVTVIGIEDALLLKFGSKFSPLREGWGGWFDAKSDLFRKDRMFKSNLEVLNPVNNPLLQDPDGVGVTGLTRGDKLVQKGLVHEMEKAPLIINKSLEFSDIRSNVADLDQETETGQSENKTLNDDIWDASCDLVVKGVFDKSLKKNGEKCHSFSKTHQRVTKKNANSIELNVSESSGSMYAGGRRWGYFPGLHPYLSFSNFMNVFFRKSRCSMRVFMVWNSPPWMYTVRHQRGLESVVFHHPEACIVVFSETIELDFFKEFLKDGFKIAVTMPNLEELLKDTPTSIFASVWHEWRTTRFYSTHYSELIRLAALYKYGGIYLDCDIIVLKPLSSLNNSLGMEGLAPGSLLNGAVMAFSKHSSFIMQCMLEFFSSYDDTRIKWNGAELITRVAGNLSIKANDFSKEHIPNVQPASIFFPISSHNIQRYFIAPVADSEKAHQEALLEKILNDSYTFHFWNSLTSALVPEPYSLVEKILNNFCIHCFDVL